MYRNYTCNFIKNVLSNVDREADTLSIHRIMLTFHLVLALAKGLHKMLSAMRWRNSPWTTDRKAFEIHGVKGKVAVQHAWIAVLLLDNHGDFLTCKRMFLNHLFRTWRHAETILQDLPTFGGYQNMEQSRCIHVCHGSRMTHGLHQFRGKSIQNATDLLFESTNGILAPHEDRVDYRMDLFQRDTHVRVLKDPVLILMCP